MSKRSRAEHKAQESEQTQLQTVAQDAWDTPEFRRSVLVDLAFVTLPAIVMVALSQRTIAAAWFGVGVLVVAFQSWPQIRGFWRWLRSGRRTGQEEGEDQG